jgi:hypothetical protein
MSNACIASGARREIDLDQAIDTGPADCSCLTV